LTIHGGIRSYQRTNHGTLASAIDEACPLCIAAADGTIAFSTLRGLLPDDFEATDLDRSGERTSAAPTPAANFTPLGSLVVLTLYAGDGRSAKWSFAAGAGDGIVTRVPAPSTLIAVVAGMLPSR